MSLWTTADVQTGIAAGWGGMKLKSYEFRDPARLVEEVAERVPLSPGAVYVVLVAHPSTAQRVVEVRRLESPAMIDDYWDARAELCELMRQLPIPEHPPPPRHAALTVVVRPGLCVFGPNEGRWMSAWRYSNHLTNAFDGDLILVTEHGWTDLMTEFAGHSPAMEVVGGRRNAVGKD